MLMCACHLSFLTGLQRVQGRARAIYLLRLEDLSQDHSRCWQISNVLSRALSGMTFDRARGSIKSWRRCSHAQACTAHGRALHYCLCNTPLWLTIRLPTRSPNWLSSRGGLVHRCSGLVALSSRAQLTRTGTERLQRSRYSPAAPFCHSCWFLLQKGSDCVLWKSTKDEANNKLLSITWSLQPCFVSVAAHVQAI